MEERIEVKGQREREAELLGGLLDAVRAGWKTGAVKVGAIPADLIQACADVLAIQEPPQGEWQHGFALPLRVGEYERKYDDGVFPDRWDGLHWSNAHLATAHPSLPWRVPTPTTEGNAT